MLDVMEAIRRRRSVREYRGDPIPQAVLERVTDALRLAPSACNYQPWRFLLVMDPRLRGGLARACHGQIWMAEAPVTVVACALPDAAYKRMGETWNSADVDVAIALDHLMLAAAGEGLGSCWIGSFDEKAVKKLLDIPAEAKVVGLTPLGWPLRDGLIRPVLEGERKPRAEVFSTDRW
jgi:nitroreductase